MASTEVEETQEGQLVDKKPRIHLLKVDKAGEITLDFKHPDGIVSNGRPIELRLYDKENNEIAVLTARGNTKLYATVPGEGTYNLSVRDADSSSSPVGAYSFTSLFKNSDNTVYDGGANNNIPNALDLPLDHVARGRLEYRDTDVFMIEPDAGGTLKLQFSHPNGQGTNGNLIRLELTDEQGHVLVGVSTRGNQAFETTVASGGKYYVSVNQVFSIPPEPGLYTLAPVFDTYKDVIYDRPVNDTGADAQLLPLGRTAIGRMGAGDADVYKFDASSAGKLSLNFMHPQGAGSGGSLVRVEISDSLGQTIFTKSERGSELSTVDLPNGGSYTVKLSNPFSTEVKGYYSLMHGLSYNGGKTIALDNAGVFAGTAGNDVVHGSNGRDIMAVSGNAGQHKIDIYPAGATLHDTTGAGGLDTLFNVERIKFADKMMAIDIQGVGGQAFRLYEAAFNRASDAAGLGFWIDHLDNGVPLKDVAKGFIDSREFDQIHGPNLDNRDFVAALYENVLDRIPDEAGIDYWVRQLTQGNADRADVLIAMANSDENIAKLVGVMMHGIEYIAWES